MTDNDPLRELWATDQGDKFTMSIAELNARSDLFRSQIKRRNLTEYFAAALVVGVFGWMALTMPERPIKMGATLIILAAVYVCWRLNKMTSISENLPVHEDLASAHRRELVRQRAALLSVWRWYLLPFVPGLLVFVLGSNIEAGVPVTFWEVMARSAFSIGLIALIFAGVWGLNWQAARKLEKEIQALDAVSLDA